MHMQIKSRILGRTLTFTRPGRSYLYVDLNGSEGSLGKQLCRDGRTTGSTITLRGEHQPDFNRLCRRWYTQYIRNVKRGTE